MILGRILSARFFPCSSRGVIASSPKWDLRDFRSIRWPRATMAGGLPWSAMATATRFRDWFAADCLVSHKTSRYRCVFSIFMVAGITSASGSIPPSGISPPNRQSAKPLNPVSTKSQEGHTFERPLALLCRSRCGPTPMLFCWCFSGDDRFRLRLFQGPGYDDDGQIGAALAQQGRLRASSWPLPCRK
jgi:hypothetical protein